MLNVILGRNGTNKTEFIYSKIKEDVLNNEDVIFIVPEQNSFVSEYKLLELLGEENIGKVSCLSFTRLAYEIERICGNNDLPTLSNGAKAVLMKKAINNCEDKLTIYKNSVKHLSFINSVIDICDEMTGCEATPKIVESVADEIEKKSLKSKLYDISAIMKEYNSLIENKYFDTALELSRLYEKLVNLNFFKDKTVYIDGFFTCLLYTSGKALLPEISNIDKDDIAVVELSSFQLISIHSSPDIAVVTNLAPNHLDHHKDMQEDVYKRQLSIITANALKSK